MWTSTTLQPDSWTEDVGATAGQAASAPDANGVQAVQVTLTDVFTNDRLFVRIQAAE